MADEMAKEKTAMSDVENTEVSEVVDNPATEGGGEVTPNPTLEAEPTSAVDPKPGEVTPKEGENTLPPGTPEPAAAFAPNLKYKSSVWNKETKALEQKEFEIDDRFKEIMKDPEAEKLVRELHEKAQGIEGMKERLTLERQRIQEVSQESTGLKNQINDARSIYQKAIQGAKTDETKILHLESFFKKLDIPNNVIFEYAIQHAKLLEMDPSQRNAIVGHLQAEQQADELRLQQSQSEQTTQQLIHQAHSQAMNMVLERPEVKALSEAFDARTGTPGSFAQKVWDEGNIAYVTQNGKVLTPEQAVQAAIARYSLTNSPLLPPAKENTGNPAAPASAAPNGVGVNQGNGKRVVQRETKVIPNVTGSGSASPAQSKSFNSIEDLVKYRKEAHGV